MLTIKKIEAEFVYIRAMTGSDESYHNAEIIEDKEAFCDVYFQSENKKITQTQVDSYNGFLDNLKKYKPEIEHFIQSNLSLFETKKSSTILKLSLNVDIIEVPFINTKYDLVAICRKTYTYLGVFKQDINVRVEMKNGVIKSISRKKDLMEDNG